ncbi:MAG: carbohydrate-binding protein [Victivallales bacterium]|nr:carbohydrate-binding protein [Victivallales bacterium]
MKNTSTYFLFLLACFVASAAEWRVEDSGHGRLTLCNETGQYGGYRQGVLFINRSVIQGRKLFALDKFPAGAASQAGFAALRMFCAVADCSWLNDGELDGLGEDISLKINGRELLLKTSDPRFKAKKNKEDALRYQWVEIPFPVTWLDRNPTEVIFTKRDSLSNNDYFYPGIDTSLSNDSSWVSHDHGQTFMRNWGNFQNDRGEYLMRLVIDTGVPRREQAISSDLSANLVSGKGLQLHGDARLEEHALRLSGQNGGGAVLTDSEHCNITENGLSLVAVMRFREDGFKKGQNAMVFYKQNAFFLGRTGNLWNFSFCSDGKSWNQALTGGAVPSPGKWFHLAATVEHVNDHAEGDVGYLAKVHVNGEKVLEKFFRHIHISQSTEPVLLGFSPKYSDYFLNADIGEAAVFQRVFGAGEIAAMAANAPKVCLLPPGTVELSPMQKAFFQRLKHAATSREGHWLATSLERAAILGDQRPGLPDSPADLGLLDKPEEMTGRFNAAQQLYTLLESPQALLLMVRGSAEGCPPVAGLFHRRAGTGTFGNRIWEWRAAFRDEKWRGNTIASYDKGLKYQVQDKGEGNFKVLWKHADFLATSNIRFDSGMLSADFSLQAVNPALTITSVTFPAWNFAKLPGKKCHLAYPHMCGQLLEEPFNDCNLEGRYPCTRVSMQFSALYDNLGNGVYFAFEDPRGRVKDYVVSGHGGQLQASWTHPVAYAAKNPGGNGYDSSGHAVIRLFEGDWFDAGQCYKRDFLPQSAWWTPRLPRETTPKWYRENPGMICGVNGMPLAREFAALQNYFGLDIIAQWVWWYHISQDEYPRYDQGKSSADSLPFMEQAGLRTESYANPRLWGYDPARSYQWRGRLAERVAVKDEAGEPVIERYGTKDYPVACPACPETARLLEQNIKLSVSYGIDAIYNDELAAGRPHLCFDPNHGHPLNDPTLWLEKGYYPMYEAIRKALPDVPHDTEDACEVYAKCVDAFMPWRWTDEGRIPLFQSIFAGRVQFCGRAYDAFSSQGDWQSFFSKAAEQLVYGEQISWFHLYDMRYASPRRLFLRKMLHLRKALAPWLNVSDMCQFLATETPVTMVESHWGGIGATAKTIKSPQIMHSVWRRQDDGRSLVVFVNLVNQQSEIRPILPDVLRHGHLAVLREGTAEPDFIDLGSSTPPKVSLAARASQVWIVQPNRDVSPEMACIAETLKAMGEMKGWGPILTQPQNKKARNQISARPGEWVAPVQASWMEKCYMPGKYGTFDKSPQRWIQADCGATVFWGEVDFGNQPGTTLEIWVAADVERAGGKIIFQEQGSNLVMAELDIPVTGEWADYKLLSTPLARPFIGRHDLTSVFTGGCNIKAWRVVSAQ